MSRFTNLAPRKSGRKRLNASAIAPPPDRSLADFQTEDDILFRVKVTLEQDGLGKLLLLGTLAGVVVHGGARFWFWRRRQGGK